MPFWEYPQLPGSKESEEAVGSLQCAVLQFLALSVGHETCNGGHLYASQGAHKVNEALFSALIRMQHLRRRYVS